MTAIAAAVYAVASLVTLWAGGGGNPELYWNRSLALGLSLSILGLGVLAQQKRLFMLKINSHKLMMGFGTALVTALPFVLLIFLLKRSNDFNSYFMVPPSFVHVLIFASFISLGHELIFRAILQPLWGVGTAALLDGLNTGFGSQNLMPFVIAGGMGYVWGLISNHFGFATALVSRSLWTLIVFTALMVL